MDVDQRVQSGEQMPFEGNNFDCVVSTFTLCSIENVSQALAEVYRVLNRAVNFCSLSTASARSRACRNGSAVSNGWKSTWPMAVTWTAT